MKWTHGVVERKIVWDHGLFTLVVRAPGVEPFEPGQFLQLGIDTATGHLHRPYSVASPHGEQLDFFVVLVEDGKLTPHLWAMEVGDKIDVSTKAAGSFTLKHCPPARTLWLMSTGTGLAPYIAMLRTAAPWTNHERIVVVHGARHGRDLAYQEEFAQFAERYTDRFRYIPVISREQFPGALHGRITTCIENGTLETAGGQVFSNESCVMLCGNPDMLNEAEELLAARGLTRNKPKSPGQIIVERYW